MNIVEVLSQILYDWWAVDQLMQYTHLLGVFLMCAMVGILFATWIRIRL
jgi:hypothetical protein